MSDAYRTDGSLPDFDDPFSAFDNWFAEAERAEPELADAASLATADARGRPSSRIVLVRGVSRAGFDFYTNYDSRKLGDIDANPYAALCFHWKSLGRQVRAEGFVERLAPSASDAYWKTRPRGSQLGAWASRQSAPIASRAALEAQLADATARFAGVEVPRPEPWGGLRLVPLRVELWQGRPDRVHDRLEFSRARADTPWRRQRLQP